MSIDELIQANDASHALYELETALGRIEELARTEGGLHGLSADGIRIVEAQRRLHNLAYRLSLSVGRAA